MSYLHQRIIANHQNSKSKRFTVFSLPKKGKEDLWKKKKE